MISDAFQQRGCPVFRGSAQGGDRYPKHGAGKSDRILPQNRSRKRRTGTAGIRCSRSSSDTTNQITELPYNPKTGAFGCGHRNRKGKQRRVTLWVIPLCCFLHTINTVPAKPPQQTDGDNPFGMDTQLYRPHFCHRSGDHLRNLHSWNRHKYGNRRSI